MLRNRIQAGGRNMLHQHLTRLPHIGKQVHFSGSQRTLHASWQTQDFSQLKLITWSPTTHLLPAPGWPQCTQCQVLKGHLPAPRLQPTHPTVWESPDADHACSAPGRWAPQPCKMLFSSRALRGLLIRRVKIIISIFWLRKWSCKASKKWLTQVFHLPSQDPTHHKKMK